MSKVIITPATDTTPAVEIDFDTITPESITETYAAATTGEKTKIRNAIQAQMMEAVREANMEAAQAIMALSTAVQSVVAAPKVEVDLNQVVADRIIALLHAAHRLEMGDVVPAGIDADKIDSDTVSGIVRNWIDGGDRDAVSDEVGKAGDKLATAKITRTTVRGSIEAHIETAIDGLESGATLTVSQIRTRSGAASDGAIAARLYPKSGNVTLDMTALGIELADVNGVRGIRVI